MLCWMQVFFFVSRRSVFPHLVNQVPFFSLLKLACRTLWLLLRSHTEVVWLIHGTHVACVLCWRASSLPRHWTRDTPILHQVREVPWRLMHRVVLLILFVLSVNLHLCFCACCYSFLHFHTVPLTCLAPGLISATPNILVDIVMSCADENSLPWTCCSGISTVVNPTWEHLSVSARVSTLSQAHTIHRLATLCSHMLTTSSHCRSTTILRYSACMKMPILPSKYVPLQSDSH